MLGVLGCASVDVQPKRAQCQHVGLCAEAFTICQYLCVARQTEVGLDGALLKSLNEYVCGFRIAELYRVITRPRPTGVVLMRVDFRNAVPTIGADNRL